MGNSDSGRNERDLNSARKLVADGKLAEAFAIYAGIVERSPDEMRALVDLVPILEGTRANVFHPGLAFLIAHCLGVAGLHADALSPAASHQLGLCYPDPAAALETLARDRLALRLLENAVVRDMSFESAMCEVRRALVSRAPQLSLLPLVTALARQAYNNEYIWVCRPAELDAVNALARDAWGFACRAMYAPLDDGAAEFGEIADLWERTRAEPKRVAERAAAVRELLPIEDATSQAVRAMYEVNPYPRWIGLPRFEPIDAREQVAMRYPHVRPLAKLGPPLKVLIAGSGTGRHALSVATTYRDADVLAIDLSRASLGYGARMAEIENVANVEFRDADILALPRLGRKFHHIESVGVIHHMRDPRAGLEALTGCLETGGLLRLGLYAEAARAGIVAARKAIAEGGYGSDLAGMRRFRADVAAGRHGAALRDDLIARADFHSASLLRDLCFHVQEHRFDCARIVKLLDGLPLRFLGFEFVLGQSGQGTITAPQFQLYRARFPDEPTFSSLSNWAALEMEKPDLFDGYVFWCLRL
ncbi:MAG: methyltransferase domain-containing protein [Alphaproteobacteria bacterium]|nr:methyltransferase domain-containing protein [Alphaproteobacteria bacterium]